MPTGHPPAYRAGAAAATGRAGAPAGGGPRAARSGSRPQGGPGDVTRKAGAALTPVRPRRYNPEPRRRACPPGRVGSARSTETAMRTLHKVTWTALVLGCVALGATPARAGIGIGIGVGFPGYYRPYYGYGW